MLDIQLLRAQTEIVAAALASRGMQLDVAAFASLEDSRKALQTRTQELQARRNALSKQIGAMKGRGEDAAQAMSEVAGIADELSRNELALAELLERINGFLAGLPNLPHESVPAGRSEADNVEILRWGSPRSFDSAVRDHVDLGTGLGGLDFETAARLDPAQSLLAQNRTTRRWLRRAARG